ncbi:MAG: D-alanyl-D-alanine carboxypeptidase [Proteobacteria bacterium]|nr:D-alanyl-D-alanine carboxypeptidase [Pseudomonadota bacterium]
MIGATPVRAANGHAGELRAKAAIAMDLATGNIVYEQNADEQIAPASLTKVLTLYLAFEAVQEKRLAYTDTVLVTPEATLAGGSRMNIRPGERVIVRELMKGIAVASGNDACVALAQHLCGSEDVHPFVAAMNAKARELGMTDTVFKNPNGMPAEGQVTTARDMLKLSASYLRRFPQALTFHSMTTYVHNNRNHHNANRLLSSYEGVDGLKTGYVQSSGYNNVVTAKRGDSRVVAVVLGARSAGARAAVTRQLLDITFQKLNQGKSIATLEEHKGSGKLPASLAKIAPRQDKDLKDAQVLADSKVALLQQNTAPVASEAPADNADSRSAGDSLIQRRTAKGAYAIQESSFQSRQRAVRRAQHLEMKGLPVKVVATRLDGKGKFYRVLVGPYANAADARKTERMLGHGSVTVE